MRDIICIGASAGGVQALQEVLAGFSSDLAAAVFIVLHMPSYRASRLDEVLSRAGPLRAEMARDGLPFEKGRIYIAPPDHHLLLERGKMAVLKGPKENRVRPAIDPLFRSAAEHYPARTIGVLLSGTLDDGTAGLWALKRAGGLAVIQDLNDAAFPDMPRNAAQYVKMDHTGTAADLGVWLSSQVREKSVRSPAGKISELTRLENKYAKVKIIPRARLAEFGTPSSMICPACNGPLWRIDEGPPRYRCHTGHSYTPHSLLAEHRELTERTLSVLMTLFDDEVDLSQQMLEKSAHPGVSRQLQDQLQESEKRAAVLRKLLPGGFEQ